LEAEPNYVGAALHIYFTPYSYKSRVKPLFASVLIQLHSLFVKRLGKKLDRYFVFGGIWGIESIVDKMTDRALAESSLRLELSPQK